MFVSDTSIVQYFVQSLVHFQVLFKASKELSDLLRNCVTSTFPTVKHVRNAATCWSKSIISAFESGWNGCLKTKRSNNQNYRKSFAIKYMSETLDHIYYDQDVEQRNDCDRWIMQLWLYQRGKNKLKTDIGLLFTSKCHRTQVQPL